jgi:hypothetical protein
MIKHSTVEDKGARKVQIRKFENISGFSWEEIDIVWVFNGS